MRYSFCSLDGYLVERNHLTDSHIRLEIIRKSDGAVALVPPKFADALLTKIQDGFYAGARAAVQKEIVAPAFEEYFEGPATKPKKPQKLSR